MSETSSSSSPVTPHYGRPLECKGYALPRRFTGENGTQGLLAGVAGDVVLLTTVVGWDVWVAEDDPEIFFSVRLSDLLVEYEWYSKREQRLMSPSPGVPQSVLDFITAYCRLTLS